MTIPESIAFALAYCAIGTLFSAAYAMWRGWKWPHLNLDAEDRTVIALLGLFWPASGVLLAFTAFIATITLFIINIAHRKGAEMGKKP